MLLVFKNCFDAPKDANGDALNPHTYAIELLDDPSGHQDLIALLSSPRVVADKVERDAVAPALCGAKYFSHAKGRKKIGVDGVTCLVLDVDDEEKAERVPNEDELRAGLAALGVRAIVYSSASHTKAKPRWRVLILLATPLKPTKHRSLVQWFSDNLVPGFKGCIDVGVTGDCTRLGFVGVTMHPEDYTWFEVAGPNFDWTKILLQDEDWSKPPLGKLWRSSAWTERRRALDQALKYDWIKHQNTSNTGGHRVLILWFAAIHLWWSWAAEDEDFVLEVLRHINAQFPEAKDDDVVVKRCESARLRTVVDGPAREPQTLEYGCCRELESNSSRDSIKEHARRLKQRKSTKQAALGEELLRIARGETPANDPSNWTGVINRCAQELAQTYGSESPGRIAGHFKESLATMAAAAGAAAVPTLDDIALIVEQRIKKDEKRKAEQEAEDIENTKRNISFATSGARDNTYSAAEWAAWNAPNGPGLTGKTGVVVHKKVQWVFLNGTFAGPYNDIEFEAQGYTDLEAAHPYIVTTTTDKNGKKTFVKLSELRQQYGTTARAVKIDFRCDKTWFDVQEKTMMLAGPPKLDLAPKFHPEIDQWLRVMTGRETPTDEKTRQEEAGKDRAWVKKAAPVEAPPVAPVEVASVEVAPVEVAPVEAPPVAPVEAAMKASKITARFSKWAREVVKQPVAARAAPPSAKTAKKKVASDVDWSGTEAEDDYDTICNWLACLTQLEHTCAALYLEGEKGVGKGLFADGIARIWKNGKISITAAFGHFNALLADSPLIHVDEGLPKDMSASVLLRRTLAAYEHEYTRKHQDSGKIQGCVRMLFTANNLDIFSRDKEMVKKEDVDALADRFAHIKVRSGAADYLESLGHKHHDFVEKNMLAEHVLWLNEQRWPALRDRDLRFLVKGKNTNVSDVVATNSSSTSDVCNAVCKTLIDGKRSAWLDVRDGVVFVNAAGLQVVLTQPPWSQRHSEREVTRAVASISEHKHSHVLWTNEKSNRMWSVRSDALRAWCQNTSVCAWEDVQRGLDKINNK